MLIIVEQRMFSWLFFFLTFWLLFAFSLCRAVLYATVSCSILYDAVLASRGGGGGGGGGTYRLRYIQQGVGHSRCALPYCM